MSNTALETIVAQLTPKGRETMKTIGEGKISFFDGGIAEGEGSWGSALTGDLGHKSSGIINRLRDLGLFVTSPAGPEDESDWWSLTALGADVANYLAGNIKEPTVKVGRKWTYIYAADGSLIAEVRNDSVAAVIASLSR